MSTTSAESTASSASGASGEVGSPDAGPGAGPGAATIAVFGVLVGLAMVSAVVFAPDRTGDLDFFVEAYLAMVGGDGFGVYAELPNIQSGPLSLLAVGLVEPVGPWAFPLAVALAYVATIAAAWRLPGARERSPLTWLVGGVVLLFWWRTFAFQGHLDDAIAVALAVAATAAAQRRRHLGAGVLVGVALAVKPWSVFLLPLAMRTSGPWHRRFVGPLAGLAIGVAAWAPFVLADRGTLDGMRPTVWIAPDSVLRLVTGSAWTMPTALRLAQLALCLAVVAWCVLRGHAAWALFAGVAVRLLLDGGTWPYYTAGLVAGALVFDLTAHRRRLPWAVLVATVLLPKPTWVEPDELRALLRFLACAAALGAVLRCSRRARSGPGGSTLVALDGDPADRASHDLVAGRAAPGAEGRTDVEFV